MIEEAFQAARLGDVVRLKQLLASDPSLSNTENSDGLTILGFASHFGQVNAAELLLEYGANINALSHSKISYIPSNTALHAAIAGERNLKLIELLLENHAQTTIFDSIGHTCLHSAAFHDDNEEIVKMLVEHGADVNAAVEGGETALSLALERGNHHVAEFLKQKGAV